MKTRYLLLEFIDPVDVPVDVPLIVEAVGRDGVVNGSPFTIGGVHLFDESTSAVRRVRNFLMYEKAIGGVLDA